MPIHSHDGAERLKPKRMRQPAQEFFTPIMMDDGLRDDRAKPRLSAPMTLVVMPEECQSIPMTAPKH
jgi:hypothetical protein